jgi:hypothetical protein
MLRHLFRTDLRFDPKIAAITVVSTLALTTAHYHTAWRPASGVLLFLVLPMAFILVVFRENPREYGFQVGDSLGDFYIRRTGCRRLFWMIP